MSQFRNDILKYKCISIIGLHKNAGKTTTLNGICKLLDYKDIMLTSIGYDGEKSDLVFETSKPTIKIKAGCIIASAKQCILSSYVNFKILEVTNIKTSLGQVVIAQALDDGHVLLAGPATSSGMQSIKNKLYYYNPDGFLLIDGALNKKCFAINNDDEGIIYCSSRALYKSDRSFISELLYEYNKSQALLKDLKILSMIKQSNCKVVLINKDYKYLCIDKPIISIERLPEYDNISYLYIDGAISDYLINKLFLKYQAITIILNSPFYNLVSYKTAILLEKLNIKIIVIDKINTVALSINTSNDSSSTLLNLVRSEVDTLVIDLVKEGLDG